MFWRTIVAFLIVGSVASVASATPVASTSTVISSADNYTGFETIGPYFRPNLYDGSAGYTDGGITVTYVGTDTGIMTGYLHNGNYSWYNSGGGDGFTSIRLADGSSFSAIQLFAGDGYSVSGTDTLSYVLLYQGAVVGSGEIGSLLNTSLSPFGFSGGLFDELRVWTSNPSDGKDTLVLDDISMTSVPAVPEPATWAMMLLGFVGIGLLHRRNARKAALSTAN